MVKIHRSHKKLSESDIMAFEKENNVQLTKQYKKFLLKWNGGFPEPSLFHISPEQGSSVLNVFFGIGEMYDNLNDYMELLDDRLPKGFIPIGDDPAGNIICLGIEGSFYEKIYFWDHEQETDDPNQMSNMYFLSNNISEFLIGLFPDE
ncbi:SMI1/KNR4 family protein [Shimazuella kribbensis]|uniref:SMI1/KNR4 family protein n=1 Tax=Shimazuella kribbensis TaxID=139808 RepID=UPI0004122C0B|nr:SMI1/KNR4 family protein [Shimazuella kribbensis]